MSSELHFGDWVQVADSVFPFGEIQCAADPVDGEAAYWVVLAQEDGNMTASPVTVRASQLTKVTFKPGDRVSFAGDPDETGTVVGLAVLGYQVHWDNSGEATMRLRGLRPAVPAAEVPAVPAAKPDVVDEDPETVWLAVIKASNGETVRTVGVSMNAPGAELLLHDIDWDQYPGRTGHVVETALGAPVQSEPEPERTTKRVTGRFTAVFHGDYLDKDEVFGHLEQWIDAGLEDRDNLRSWTFTCDSVTEVGGDPEGYDR